MRGWPIQRGTDDIMHRVRGWVRDGYVGGGRRNRLYGVHGRSVQPVIGGGVR